MSFLTKIFGDPNEKQLKQIRPLVEKVNELEDSVTGLSAEDLLKKSKELRKRSQKEPLDNLLPEAFALVRETAKRTLNERHYDSQVIGAIALHQGKIAEMKTGEGKTLSATLPIYLNALTGKGVHVVTVNDYLARRDTVWMGQIYHYLGLSVGCINDRQSFVYDPDYKSGTEEEKDDIRDTLGSFRVQEDFLRPCTRKEAYAADITYGTNNQFGFDYLRDNMVNSLDDRAQREFNYAIIDEVDSILIDEARTPLIISIPEEGEDFDNKKKMYLEFSRMVPHLKAGEDYEVKEKEKAVNLTEEGVEKVEKMLNVDNIYEERGINSLHHLEQALRAQAKSTETGKPLYEKDIHYVIKDGEVIIVDSFTGRLMPGRRWSGGLHQAIEAKEGLNIQPESETMASVTFQNLFRMYNKLSGMTGTAASSAEELYAVYGTEVVIIPTHKPLIRKDLPDRVYKTKKAKLGAVVAEVKRRSEQGQPVLLGTVSIEDNELISKMLMREGIKHLLLNAKNHEKEAEIIAQAGSFGAVTVATNMAGRGVDIILGGNPPDKEESEKVRQLGGLFVLGTERHEARRIDDQLRGRCGRQGDPGESQFYVSLEDNLMRIFAGERIQDMMSRFNLPEDEPIEMKFVSNIIESAQKKVEGHHFDARKHILQYDEVLFKHRSKFYSMRDEVLKRSEEGLRSFFVEIITRCGRTEEEYLQKEKEIGAENMRRMEKYVALRTMDFFWKDHLSMMEELRDSVRLRAYGQKDPLIEYKREGQHYFQQLMESIENEITERIFRVKTVQPPRNPRFTIKRNVDPQQIKMGAKRNDPCPCGSGKKYKRCCGK